MSKVKQCYFPFGEPLKRVQQIERSPKRAFVLGVYASAVHARWVDAAGKQKIAALAVASEPEIFWRGDNADQLISEIKIPDQLGSLIVPKGDRFNGPSGKILDERFLTPLKLDRSITWLCDLIPESRVNERQKRALEKYYTKDIINRFNLMPASIPEFKITDLDSPQRRSEILEELLESQADTLILLGDLPIKWFLRYHDKKYSRLSDLGTDSISYGKGREVKIGEKYYNVIALCHPRQAGRLGRSSNDWGDLHDTWVKQRNAGS